MQKRTFYLPILLFFLLILSSFAYAEGSSTGSDSANVDTTESSTDLATEAATDTPTESTPDAATKSKVDSYKSDRIKPRRIVKAAKITAAKRASHNRKKAQLKDQYSDKNCENLDSKEERIKCRLAHGRDYATPTGTIPEACRKLENPNACKALYKNVQKCYDHEGNTKDKCFKKVANFVKAKLSDEDPSARRQKARDYLITLLYDLQGRIELASEDGNIDPDLAAELIDKIVEIKQAILDGATKSEVREMMQDLRQLWKDNLVEEEETDE